MDKYREEAKRRFENTDAYKEFEIRAKDRCEADFEASAEGMEAIFEKFSQCKAEGNTPDSEKAQLLSAELQSFITDNFYTCTKEILRALGNMYTADDRFRENIDKHGFGTAEFVSSAIEIYTK